MNNKAIIFSDLHIHDYKQFNDGAFSRLEMCLKVLEDIFVFADKHGIETIFFCGDIFDTQKALLTIVVNKTVAKFKDLFTRYPQVKMFAITGNHDQSSKSLLEHPAVSALDFLQTIFTENFIVCDNSITQVSEGIHVAGIPYFEYKEHFAIKLNDIVSMVDAMTGLEEADLGFCYLMIHQTAKGNANEMIPYDTNPADEIYKKFTHTFCGHIHQRQEITENFTNVGSPIHRDLGDVGEVKGFYVMNLAKPEKGKIFVPLPDYPQFRMTTVEDEVDNGDYVIMQPDYEALRESSTANVEEFNTSLDNKDLLTNFWKQVDGKDEELLKVGLKFI